MEIEIIQSRNMNGEKKALSEQITQILVISCSVLPKSNSFKICCLSIVGKDAWLALP